MMRFYFGMEYLRNDPSSIAFVATIYLTDRVSATSLYMDGRKTNYDHIYENKDEIPFDI